MLQPCNLADQFSLTETGERIPKKRLTHDLSSSLTQEDASVNSRIDMDEYPPMIYGWALMRIIAFICALRLAFPDIKILISKYDLSDAYRRICHDALAAAQTILVLGIKAYIMLRLSFGGAPNPAAWTAFSEMVTDLSNDLPRDPNWDPDKLHHPLQKQVPTPEYLDDGIPLAPAREMAVNIPTTAKGRGDCFIDDII